MTTIKSRPLLSYFVLAFAISWGAVLTVIVVGHGSILATKEQFETLIPFAGPAMLLGPSVAGLLLTGLLYGKAGFRDLLARLTRWRVGARWYAVALLTAPLLYTAILLVLSVRSREFLPTIFTSEGKATLLLMGIFAGLVIGIFEELGWTGFAIPTADCDDIDPYALPNTRLAVATLCDTRLRSTTGRRLPVLLLVRNSATERCRASLPKLRCVCNKQEEARP